MELKPCPFCGGKVRIIFAPFDVAVRIECAECRYKMVFQCKWEEKLFDCSERAKKAFNRRVGEGEKYGNQENL